jgi:bifunctional enzyme CysN/CysC
MLVDPSKGLRVQTRVHSYVASLLGISRIVLAVNKMDTIDYARDVFEAISHEFDGFARSLGLKHIVAIPISALRGDNVATRSPSMPWYSGPTVVKYLKTVDFAEELSRRPMRLPVESVSHPSQGVRGLAGYVAVGTVRKGDRVRALPSGKESRIARIVTTQEDDLDAALPGQSVTVVPEEEVDASPGDVLAAADSPPQLADQFQATIVWMHHEPLLPGRAYLMRIGARLVGCSITTLKHKIDINTMEHVAARLLALDEIGVCNVATDGMVPCDQYTESPQTGRFLLIDKLRNEPAGAGFIHFALRRSENIHWQALDIDRRARAAMKKQRASVLWFTGLSGAGKSTIANYVEKHLHALGRHTYVLDGDNVRHGLNKDLGFTEADRVENIRRVAEVSKLMVDAGLIVMVAFISPFRAERRTARELFAPDEFYEIFIDTPLAEAERRDRKGLYKKARRGELLNFTGIDSPYEAPKHPEIRVDTTIVSAEAAAEAVVRCLKEAGRLEN